jgi:hypothetical protein
MESRLYHLLASTILVIASLNSPSKVNAQSQVPPVYLSDTNDLSNGSMAIELCNRYLYRASINPNNLELQQLALACQNIHSEYALCVIQTNPEESLSCMENGFFLAYL